jgi:hypothetical protein
MELLIPECARLNGTNVLYEASLSVPAGLLVARHMETPTPITVECVLPNRTPAQAGLVCLFLDNARDEYRQKEKL